MNFSQSMGIFLKDIRYMVLLYICRPLVRMMVNRVHWGPTAVCTTHTVQESLFLVLTILQDSKHTPVTVPTSAHWSLFNSCEQEQ